MKKTLLKKVLSSILVASFFGGGFAIAQEVKFWDLYNQSFEDLLKEGVSVGSASAKAQTVFETGSNVTVIDGATIDKYNFQTVSEALQIVPGFQVLRTYLKRNIATSRGIHQDHYSNKVLVLINNIPAWNAITGESSLDRIDINDVSRIEVLKGGASVVYGTNAYSGAVNIVLKQLSPGEVRSEMHAGVGSNQFLWGGGNYQNSQGENSSLFISANFSEEDGIDFDFTDETGRSGELQEHVNTQNFTVNFSKNNHTILFNGFKAEESNLGVLPRYTFGAGNSHNISGYLTNYRYDLSWSDQSSSSIDVFYDYQKRSLSRTENDNTRSNNSGYRYGATLNNSIQIAENTSLQLGASYDLRKSRYYRDENTEEGIILSENNLKGAEVDEWSLFGQVEADLNPFRLIGGVRFTDNEFSGSNTSSRGTIVYNFSETSALKLVAAQSYRSPSLFELNFISAARLVFGTLDLDPEESDSFELIYQVAFENVYIQATAYTATYENKIFRTRGDAFLPDGTVELDTIIYANGNEFEADGFELEIKYLNEELFDLFFNAGFVDGDNGDQVGTGNYNFFSVPEFTASGGIYKRIGNFGGSVVVNYQDDTQSSTSPVDDSTWVDLNLFWNPESTVGRVTHQISIKNLTDEDVSYPEYVRQRGVNSVPLSSGVRAFYTVKVRL